MEKAIRFEKPSEVHTAVGKEICVTDWVTVDQLRIDKFAEATDDFQWIHVDVERAKTSPYGGTIAHGFLTLSLLGGFYEPYLQHAFPFCDLGLTSRRSSPNRSCGDTSRKMRDESRRCISGR
jgi:acyl dehydratase